MHVVVGLVCLGAAAYVAGDSRPQVEGDAAWYVLAIGLLTAAGIVAFWQ